MAQLALILGNGFDIDMGLPSKYSDFANSEEWNQMIRRVDSFLQSENYSSHSLIGQLQVASKESQWFDIEEEIYKFVNKHRNNKKHEIGEIRNEFALLNDALCKYLQRVTTNFRAQEDKLSVGLLYHLRQCPLSVAEIYFNYTSPHEYINMPYQLEIKNGTTHECSYVHGSLKNNDIVLGCDLQEGEQVNRQLSFMYKYNKLHKANHVARHLLEAEEIIIFGHSVNEMDFCYFREFLKVASASPKPIRHLTIFTKDEDSERAIKDNIRNQGISVSDLYSNLWTLDFIHTQKWNECDQEEIDKWDSLIKRILTPRVRGVKIRY